MKATDQELEAMRKVYPAATPMGEGGSDYVYVPGLVLQVGEEALVRDALLGLTHGGYGVRLYLSEPVLQRQTIRGNAANWSSQTILGRTWHVWSWRGVPREQPALRSLVELMDVLR